MALKKDTLRAVATAVIALGYSVTFANNFFGFKDVLLSNDKFLIGSMVFTGILMFAVNYYSWGKR